MSLSNRRGVIQKRKIILANACGMSQNTAEAVKTSWWRASAKKMAANLNDPPLFCALKGYFICHLRRTGKAANLNDPQPSFY